MEKDHIEKLLEQHAAQISEHVSSVQIVVTVNEGVQSYRYSAGSGCWYARMGAIRELVLRDNATIAESVRNRSQEDEED